MAIDKVVDSAVLDGYFADIADAIRDKGGSGTYTPAQMPQAIEDLPAGDPNLIALLEGTATGELTIRGLTSLLGLILLFDGIQNHGVTKLTLPDLVKGQNNGYHDFAGGGISNPTGEPLLEELNVPKATSLLLGNSSNTGGYQSNAFKNLKVLNAPLLTDLYGTIRTNNKMTSVSLPKATTIGTYFFNACTALQSANLPELRSVQPNCFQGCTALESINMPKVQTVQGSAFWGCSALEYVRMPLMRQSASAPGGFYQCTSLVTADFGSSTVAGGTFGAYFLMGCTVLDALVLRYSSVNSMNSANGIANTAIANGNGYIYVPRALISTYESATNWSAYAGQFRAIEDYTDDGTIDGEFIHP